MTTKTSSILKNYRFNLLLSAFTAGSIGDFFDFFAIQILFAYTWHASPYVIGSLFIVILGPMMIFGQFAGMIVDRVNKLHLMIATDIASGLLTLGLFLSPNPTYALIFIFLRSSLASFNNPCMQALTQEIAHKDQLLQASSFLGVCTQLSKISGPLLGAVVISMSSAKACIAINAVSFFISAAILTSLITATIGKPHIRKIKEKFQAEWLQGFKIILNSRTLLVAISLILIALTFIIMVESQLVLLLKELAPYDKSLLAKVLAMTSLGALASSYYLSRRKQSINGIAYIAIGILLTGVGYLIISAFQPAFTDWYICAASLTQGLGFGIISVVGSFLIKKEVAPEHIGRVFGIYISSQCAAFIFGGLLGAVIVAHFSATATFFGIGVAALVIGAVSLIQQRLQFNAIADKSFPPAPD